MAVVDLDGNIRLGSNEYTTKQIIEWLYALRDQATGIIGMGTVKTHIATADSFEIPEDHQSIVFGDLTVDGELIVSGELVLL